MPDDPLQGTGLKIGNYKCFKKPEGFENILPFNIIIGRNNAGKSALLDVLPYIVTRQSNQMLALDGKGADVHVTTPIQATEIERVISPAWGNKNRIIGRRITWSPHGDRQLFISVEEIEPPVPRGLLDPLANNAPNPFFGYHCKRLRAERDIKPEQAATFGIAADGTGATRTIHHFRTHAERDSAILEHTMLDDLNTIFGTDAHFTRIDTREDQGTWEVYLDEEQKGRIRLSRSGSGLKTVILVLAYLHLIPRIENADTSKYLYVFEELENNLHPAVQRRLLHFLREFSEQHGCHFFLTTHSPVEIDYFARDEHAQVLHVTNDATNASVTTISAYAHGKHVLDDLDIRASDILQSNGIIWVEGPSDRLYLNRWIELWTDGTLREGAHYQVLQYGGSLMAHLTALPPDALSDAIHILTTNRNAAVLMDSDKTNTTDDLSLTKRRIINELEVHNGLSWVTSGRTIENYIPTPLWQKTIGRAPGPYEHAITFIADQNPQAATKLPSDKVKLARTIITQLTRDHLVTLDLAEKVGMLCDRIKQWNGM